MLLHILFTPSTKIKLLRVYLLTKIRYNRRLFDPIVILLVVISSDSRFKFNKKAEKSIESFYCTNKFIVSQQFFTGYSTLHHAIYVITLTIRVDDE